MGNILKALVNWKLQRHLTLKTLRGTICTCYPSGGIVLFVSSMPFHFYVSGIIFSRLFAVVACLNLLKWGGAVLEVSADLIRNAALPKNVELSIVQLRTQKFSMNEYLATGALVVPLPILEK